VKIHVKAEIGFMNDKPPQQYNGKLVYVIFLAETSDGHKVHFARIRYNSQPPHHFNLLMPCSGKALNKGQELKFSASLTCSTQTLISHVMCDDFGKPFSLTIISVKYHSARTPIGERLLFMVVFDRLKAFINHFRVEFMHY
jgi:hypothetical protein